MRARLRGLLVRIRQAFEAQLMDRAPSEGVVHVAARDIPIPGSISSPAQAFLAAAASQPPLEFPPVADKQAWRQFIDVRNAHMVRVWQGRANTTNSVAAKVTTGEVPIYLCSPGKVRDALADRVIIELHGGGFVFMGGEACKLISMVTAERFGCPVYAVDYRMPPDHPFPAALEDSVDAYLQIIGSHDPKKVVILGSSAGGNLAAALALRLRDDGHPPPECLILLSPQLDLTESGDSFQTNVSIDVSLKRGLPECSQLYADGHPLLDPYLSPLFADFTRGFPPTLIQSGTRDLFLSNAVRMHQALGRSGIEAALHVLEALPHGRFFGAPEDADFADQVVQFIQGH